LIMGAAGRDFHNFNMYFKNNNLYNVVAFTATQIPGIEGRLYPPQLSGNLYPSGIPIHEEDKLEALIKKEKISKVVLAYSDLSHNDVMHRASRVMSAGADFMLLGPKSTQLKTKKRVISVVASRTGCGKSQTSRYIVETLQKQGIKIVAIRHPMPYGNLVEQKVQRFAKMEDLVKHKCTIEEREEYEPYINKGCVVYSGVDYEEILRSAEKESDVILWDGGNNDMSFIKPDVQICVVDPLRAGHELSYYPGETNVRSSDIIVINKIDTASIENILQVRKNVENVNPKAIIIEAASPISIEAYEEVRDKRVLVIEDGPTLTHGEMYLGAALLAAKRFQAKEIIDPRPFLKGSLVDVFNKYKHLENINILPAMGYSPEQIKDLENTINDSKCDLVISGTPIDISKVMQPKVPIKNVKYDLQCIGKPDLLEILNQKFQN